MHSTIGSFVEAVSLSSSCGGGPRTAYAVAVLPYSSSNRPFVLYVLSMSKRIEYQPNAGQALPGSVASAGAVHASFCSCTYDARGYSATTQRTSLRWSRFRRTLWNNVTPVRTLLVQDAELHAVIRRERTPKKTSTILDSQYCDIFDASVDTSLV